MYILKVANIHIFYLHKFATGKIATTQNAGLYVFLYSILITTGCWYLKIKTGVPSRGGELRVLRVREHPLNVEVHPLTAKSTPSK